MPKVRALKAPTSIARVPKGRRAAVAVVAFLLAGGAATGVSQAAGAAPQPTVSQVQAQVNQLTAQFNKAVEQYDQVAEQLTAAKTRLSQVNKEIASASYMDSGQTSLAGLLTSNDVAQVLAEASIITQLTGARNLETQYFLGLAQQVGSVQQEQQRTELGIQQLLGQRAQTKNHIQKLLKSKQDTLDSLTATQQQQVLAGT